MKQITFIFLAIFFFQNVSAQTYDLLGSEQYTSVSNKNTLTSNQGSINMKMPDFDMEMDGKINKMDALYKDVLTVISDTEVKIKFEKYNAVVEIEFDGEVTKEKQKVPLEGREATFIKIREKWALKNPKKVKTKHLEEFNNLARNIPVYMNSLEALFPKNVKIGDTWEAKDEELAPIVGTGNNVIGTAKLTLVSVEEKNNDIIATIGLVTKYSYDDDDGNNKMELEGTIKRSIKNYDFFKLETNGTYEMFTDTTDGGMKMKILMKGNCTLNQHKIYN